MNKFRYNQFTLHQKLNKLNQFAPTNELWYANFGVLFYHILSLIIKDLPSLRYVFNLNFLIFISQVA